MLGPSIVILEDSPRTGLENMQIDGQLLLDQAHPCLKPLNREWTSSPIILRFYYWNEPTLSLGSFQSIDHLGKAYDTEHHVNLSFLPWVQRKTGGGAILHDREITYSIIIPADSQAGSLASKGHSEPLYRAVHESVVEGLRQLGFQAQLSESCTCKPSGLVGTDQSLSERVARGAGNAEPFLCFHRRTPVDVVVGQHKVLGSAQRRVKSGLLQHGSLLLEKSIAFPRLLGLTDLGQLPDRYSGGLGKVGREGFMVWQGWLESRILDAIDRLLGPPREVFRLNSAP